MPESSSKKPHKKRKIKSKPKKHKPKLSKEFQETEKEIAAILDRTELSIDEMEEDPEAMGIAFFCDNIVAESPPKVETPPSPAEEDSEKSETPRTQTASSFIQIEDEEPIKWVSAAKVVFDDKLLFTPSSVVNPYIQNIQGGDPVLKSNANLVRMVNRCHEEGNNQQITSGSSLKNQINFFKDDLLYATVCEKEFKPIFCVMKPGDSCSPIIPSRKLITLNIKELRFTEHPLQKEEHTLANKLEDLLYSHFSRKESEIISKLNTELDGLRRTVNGLLEECTANNDLADLEGRLNKLQQLRNKVHEEEAISKDLLRNILDTWIKLKNLRKCQEFHWTSLKLKIKLSEVDIDLDTAVWTKRFETELNEIYREELEAYYRAKRLYKADPERALAKPKKPSIENIKTDLKLTLKECTRLPGEPQIEIVRSNSSDPCHPLEKIKTYYMRVLFDGQLVGSTKCHRLEPNLSLVINESLGIYLDRRIPKEITIKLYEKKKLPSVPLKIANILVPLPSIGQSAQSSEVINFSSHKQESISGRLTISFQCDEGVYSKEILNTIFPPPTPRTRIPDNVLQSWQRNPLIDYSNEALTTESPKTAKTSDDEDETEEGTCTFQETLLQFCSREEINNNQRYRLLSSIYRCEMKTKDIRFASLMEHELEEEIEEKVIDIGNWMDSIDVHKHNGKKYLRNLYEVVVNHCEQLSQITGSSEELLLGNSIVTLKSFFASLVNIFGPSRPLNPERIAQPSVSMSYQNVQKFNIVVNVVRATGIPVRSFSAPPLDRRDSSNASMFSSQTFKYSNVRPYVSATYMDRSGRTMTSDGSSPTWNEQLILQISGNPIELKGDLKIAVFDEYVENHISEERSMEIYKRFQSNWLGEYRLPISTILGRQRIEGVFELTSPKILLGYNSPSLTEALPVENIPEIKERVNVWLYVSVEPSFEMPRVTTKSLECSELKEVRHHIHEWCIEAKQMQPSRFIDPLVCTMDGKRVCLTRLLEPVPLPIEAGETDLQIMESACRYVSLLNVLKHFHPCMQFRGIWLNNQTMLDTSWGSAKDLGVLLANFLLTIGIRCWVVLGIAYPHGESAYVLYPENGGLVMVDPSTGKKYATKDVYCPMTKVFNIFSQDNIYCNIQSENRVSMMNFDVEDASCWFPMFTKKNPAPLGGVQKLNYTFKSSHSVNELRKNIERKIMKKISAWRPMQKTVWNRAFQSTMLKVLIDLEYESTFASAPPTTNHSEIIFTEFGNYKLFGFTLNFSYTNLSSISERIKSTGIHLNGDKRVEFSVAVHVHSYPFNVLSVWIFLISAIPV